MEMRKALSTNTTGKYSSACNVHLERTLDEMYYPGLSAKGLEARNNDQVISGKYRKQERSAKRVPLLMVPQLWLWRLGHTIVSAHPMQPWDKIYSRPYETISGDPYLLRSPFLDSELGEIIATYIEAFGKEQEIDGERFLPALDIFEQEVVSVLSGADEYIDKSDPGSVSFYKERRLLHTLSDVRSELAMILHVLQQQKEILTSLLKEEGKDEAYFLNNRKYSTDYESNWNRVKNAQSILESYEKKIGKIDGDADRVERAVQSLLELKRTYASVKDAHSSLLISTAVIGFTVVTIIFAPLAFLTALFALNIDGFRKLHVKGKDGVYNSGYMGGIFGRWSLVTVIPLRCWRLIHVTVSSEVLTIGLSFAAVKVSLSYLKKWDSLDEHAGGGDARDDMGERRKDKGGTKRDNKKTDLEAQGGAANAGK
jgi:hypothetical protein